MSCSTGRVGRPRAWGAWVDYTKAAKDAGVFVAAEQLTHSETAASVRVRGEDRLITDGPVMETKEHLLGFWVIDVPERRRARCARPWRKCCSGRRSLEKATAAVRSVEVRMLAGLTQTEQSDAFRILQSMTRSLRDGSGGA